MVIYNNIYKVLLKKLSIHWNKKNEDIKFGYLL